MPKLGIITGLQAEARILDHAGLTRATTESGLVVRCGGGSAVGAIRAVESLIADGADSLMSFGVAGGLDPQHRPGLVVLARDVVGPDGQHFTADGPWRARLLAALADRNPAIVAEIAGSDDMLTDTEAKRTVFNATGASIVDTESHHLARAASASGLPFLAVRAIADPSWRSVPHAASAALTSDGRTRVWPVVRKLSLRPWEIGPVAKLARDYHLAMTALRRVAVLGAPLFGLI